MIRKFLTILLIVRILVSKKSIADKKNERKRCVGDRTQEKPLKTTEKHQRQDMKQLFKGWMKH